MCYIDVTVPMRKDMIHPPGVPPFEYEDVFSMEKGDGANVRKLTFGSHLGTHFDPPYHQVIGGKKGDDLPADYFIGSAKVFELMSGNDISLKDVESLDFEPGDIILFKTPNSRWMLQNELPEEYVTVEMEAARYLVDHGIHAIGIDFPTLDKLGSGDPVHKVFLNAGIPIIEGIYLGETEPGSYQMVALFMSITENDGSPMRVLLKKESESK